MSNLERSITGRRLLNLLAAATFCYWIGLTVLMHVPLKLRPHEPDDSIPKDKTVHFVLYAGLATALTMTLAQRARVRPEAAPRTRFGRYAAVLTFCVIHGYLEELTQPLTGRTYDLEDFLTDCLGTTVALAVCFAIGSFAAPRN